MNPAKTLSVLKASHATIIAEIDRVLGCVRNYKQARNLLCGLEVVLFTHCDIHTRSLYDRLIAENHSCAKLLDFLYRDLLDFKIEFLEFLECYSNGADAIRARNFPRIFSRFSKTILQRVMLEEDQLFPFLMHSDKNVD